MSRSSAFLVRAWSANAHLFSDRRPWVRASQEQDLYKREELGVAEVRFMDNQDCIGNHGNMTPRTHIHISPSLCWVHAL